MCYMYIYIYIIHMYIYIYICRFAYVYVLVLCYSPPQEPSHQFTASHGQPWGIQPIFPGSGPQSHWKMAIEIVWLVVGPPLWKIWKSIGMIIPNIWENQKCSKPPTSSWFTHEKCWFSVIFHGLLYVYQRVLGSDVSRNWIISLGVDTNPWHAWQWRSSRL